MVLGKSFARFLIPQSLQDLSGLVETHPSPCSWFAELKWERQKTLGMVVFRV